jgi:molybdopterin-guanine dinucleotide biosynthesis protein A
MMKSTGLLLFTGGRGARLGGPKHGRPHPSGASWGGHLVDLHRRVFGGAPACILGAPLPDHPGLPVIEDPGEGPAVALRRWAVEGVPGATRWWLAPCDQVRWTEEDLRAWHALAQAADPEARAWVVAEAGGRPQPLGGFLGHGLRPALAAASATSMRGLMDAVPCLLIPADFPGFADVDTAAGLVAWQAETKGKADDEGGQE